MSGKTSRQEIKLGLKNLSPGDHLCFIYATEKEHRELLTPFMRQGLEQRECVIYMADTHTAEEVLNYLRVDGMEVGRYLENGQLVILSMGEAFKKQEVFNPEKMIAVLREKSSRALKEGYAAARITGEMSWVLNGLPGSERLMDYEVKLNEFLTDRNCAAICQYDRGRFDSTLILDALATHPVAVIGEEFIDNFYYMPPKDFLGADPVSVRLQNCLSSLVVRKRTEDTLREHVTMLEDILEKALRESEEKYSLLVNNLPGFVYKGFQDWSVEFYDNKVELLTGYNMDTFNGRKMRWIDLMIEEDIAAARQTFVQALKTNKSYVRDYRIKTKAKDIIWIQERGSIVCKKNGDVEYVSGVFFDITDLKLAEENIQNSVKKYRELYQGLRDGSASVDMQGAITEFNPVFQRMLGYSEEEIRRLTYKDITPEKWHSIEANIIEEQVFTRGYSDIYRKEYIKKDGTVLPVELRTYVIRDKENNPEGMWATIRDISERKEAERAIKESEDRYRNLYQKSKQREQLYESLLNSTPDAVGIYSLDNKAVYINPAFTRIFGFTLEDAQGKHIPFVPESEIEKTRAGRKKVLQGESVSGFETKRLTKDDKMLDVTLSSSCYTDHEGNIAGIVVFFRDITESKQVEKQLLHAQKMEAVGTLAGGVAHDFNNLLQAIHGYTELLLFDKDESEPEHRKLKEIFHAAKRGSELTRQLLTFSRKVESKKMLLYLNREVKQAKKLLERTIPKMIDIELCLAEQIKAVDADPNQVEQVIMNLAINAKDAMPEGGRLIIKTENATLDEKYCRTNLGAKPGDYVLLTVSDNGHGIDRENLDHIFEPFFTTKELGRGTGLGLAIVYGIAKSHQGYITCHSETGEGTTFKIYLPATDQKVEFEKNKEKVPAKGGTETILLVDDEQPIRSLGKEMLEKFGYEVITAIDGEEALELYGREQDRINLVILDLIMPGMGGKRCLMELLTLNAQVKVLIASGYTDITTLKETIKTGHQNFIGKPYRLGEILEAVRKILDER